MAKPSQRDLAKAVLGSYGQSYAEEIGIRLKNTPAPLFQLLNASLLLSARIPAGNAVRAARALIDAKLTTPRKMVDARVTKASKKLGLPTNPRRLAGLVHGRDFPRFVAGLVRVDLAKAQKEVQQAASGK